MINNKIKYITRNMIQPIKLEETQQLKHSKTKQLNPENQTIHYKTSIKDDK